MNQVILLNGPSSSGKSTLAKALSGRLAKENRDYATVSIDDCLERIVSLRQAYAEQVKKSTQNGTFRNLIYFRKSATFVTKNEKQMGFVMVF